MNPTRYTPELIQEYTTKGYWDSMTFSHYWDLNAQRFPHREAVVDATSRFTWAQAQQWIDRVAVGLIELGIGRDEPVVVQLPNFAELCLLRIALEKAGILCVPVLRALRHKEMEYILGYTQAAAIVIPGQYAGFDHFQMVQDLRPQLPHLRHVLILGQEVPPGAISLRRLAQPFPGRAQQPRDKGYAERILEGRRYKATEVSWVGHTSGTTGLPKFVEYSPIARLTLGRALAQLIRLTEDDVLAAIGPAAGGSNVTAYFAGPVAGAKLAMLEVFQAKPALELIQKERVTVACVSPAHLAMMLAEPGFKDYDLSSLRVLWSGGAPLSYDLGHRSEDAFGCPVINGLGAMDCGVATANSLQSTREERLLTVGKPLAWAEMKLVDEKGREVAPGEVGEIMFRGPSCAGGYYKDPGATWQAWSRDGWFRMGDLGKVDSRGNLVMIGRKKDIIIRGGQNIYPLEVENMLQAHPKVAGVAVVGMPDPVMGERACAFVVPQPGQAFTFEEMIAFLRGQRIASYKLPERLEIVDKIPLAAEQKIDKKVLYAAIVQKLKEEATGAEGQKE